MCISGIFQVKLHKKHTYKIKRRRLFPRRTQEGGDTALYYRDRNVVDFISELDKSTKIFVGSGSSYFFIGTAGRFIEDIEDIENALAFAPSKKKNVPSEKDKPEERRKPLRERCIVDFFWKFQKDGYAVIIEGSEVGGFWTEEEFDSFMKKYKEDYMEVILNCRTRCAV